MTPFLEICLRVGTILLKCRQLQFEVKNKGKHIHLQHIKQQLGFKMSHKMPYILLSYVLL